MESWCNVLVENQILFWTKVTLRRFPNPLFPRARRHIFFTNRLHILHIDKKTTEHIRKKASHQTGESCFLNSQTPKKIHASPSIQLFRQRLSLESVKAYATMAIGIMGSTSLALLDWCSRRFSNKEKERTNTCVCAVSFHQAETHWGSLKQL